MPFSQSHADAACNFIEGLLKHTADEYYGKPFILAPWQEEAVSAIFGNLDDDGNRLIQMVYIECPKKTGKTEWASALVLLTLALATAPGCQIYGAAAATRQAMNVYRAACKMVEQSPILQKRLQIRRGTNRILRRDDPDSFYAAIAADGDFGDGVNPSCTIADEVHRWKTRKQLENWDVLSNGGITRKQTLTIAITTAGVQSESPLAWRLHEKTIRIKTGVVNDPTFYGKIYAADPGDDIADPKTWIKAHPSLIENGGFLHIDKIKQKYLAAVAEGDLASFRRYFLNLWDEKNEKAIDLVKWDACQKPFIARGLGAKLPEDKVRPLHPELLRYFMLDSNDRPRRCYAGVDLSMTTDISAVALVFPAGDDTYDILPFCWIPAEGLKAREIRDGVPYRRWAEEGLIELCPGGVIDYREIKERLAWAGRTFDLRDVVFDPYNSRQISTEMVDEGFKCKELRQGMMSLSAPSKKLLELIANGKVRHGGHEILRWHASSVTAEERNDNLMFTKPARAKDRHRIDLISATVNALAFAMAERQHRSIYDLVESV